MLIKHLGECYAVVTTENAKAMKVMDQNVDLTDKSEKLF